MSGPASAAPSEDGHSAQMGKKASGLRNIGEAQFDDHLVGQFLGGSLVAFALGPCQIDLGTNHRRHHPGQRPMLEQPMDAGVGVNGQVAGQVGVEIHGAQPKLGAPVS